MYEYEWLQLGMRATWVLFVFAFGACAGSLINVLVYRLPLGLNVVTVGSRCPACGTGLTWRENIPVLGWLLLKGRCRFCKSPISPEYPMVEALVGLMFAGTFALWYFIPEQGWGPPGASVWLGIDWSLAAPDWARSDIFSHTHAPVTSWGPLIVLLVLLAGLVAMTLTDAKTSTIPLQVPWFLTLVGVIGHSIAAGVVGPLREHAPQTAWSIPLPGGSFIATADGWKWMGASIGGVLGLGVSVALLHFGLIRRSFADYQQWEDSLRAEAGGSGQVAAEPGTDPVAMTNADAAQAISHNPAHDVAGPVGEEYGQGARRIIWFVLCWLGALVALTYLGWLLSPRFGLAKWSGLAGGVVLGPTIAAMLTRQKAPIGPLATQTAPLEAPPGSSPQLWIQYPHARREMFKELLFLTPCIGMAMLGGWIGSSMLAGVTPPFWFAVLTGTLLGYLVGGGLVWLVRILGSLAFGKEAMGLGDVHMMAAVGACAGWIDASLALPLGAFVGMYWMVVTRIWTGGSQRAIPFGPYLAVATMLIIWGKPLVELGLTLILEIAPGEPGVNLP